MMMGRSKYFRSPLVVMPAPRGSGTACTNAPLSFSCAALSLSFPRPPLALSSCQLSAFPTLAKVLRSRSLAGLRNCLTVHRKSLLKAPPPSKVLPFSTFLSPTRSPARLFACKPAALVTGRQLCSRIAR